MQLLKNFDAQAVVFDKDGTLIDFDFMWGTWTLELAERLQSAINLDAREALCCAYGYDITRKKILPDGKLTCTPMWRLREIMIEVTQSLGMPQDQALCAVETAWFVPDPVTLAKPFTDLGKLFTNIRQRGIQIAIATTDDRRPSEAMLRAFGITHLVNAIVCADDGIPAKPAPDMVTAVCAGMNIDPSKTVVVGDTVADLRMAKCAGAGYVIGVLSGVGLLEHLTPLADILLDTVDTMQESFIVREQGEIHLPEITEGITGLSPDPAY